MASTVTVAQEVLNFLVVGEVRSGAAVVQSSIDSHPQACCHGDLFTLEDDTARKHAHESYFGEIHDGPAGPDWFRYGVTNPWHYLDAVVFDNNLHNESALGTKLLYPELDVLDLYEYIEDRHREGGFGLIQVLRNPVACFVSWKQAQESGVWRCWRYEEAPAKIPRGIVIDGEELTKFVRRCQADQLRLARMSPGLLTVRYEDLYFKYQATMRRVFQYLELPSYYHVSPAIRRLHNRRTIPDRVWNWSDLVHRAPSDVRYLMTKDLF